MLEADAAAGEGPEVPAAVQFGVGLGVRVPNEEIEDKHHVELRMQTADGAELWRIDADIEPEGHRRVVVRLSSRFWRFRAGAARRTRSVCPTCICGSHGTQAGDFQGDAGSTGESQ